MSPRLRVQGIARIPFHVVLWAAFPVLALWNENSLEIPASAAVSVLVPVVIVAAVSALVIALPVRSLRRGALAGAAVLVPSLLYGYAFTQADNWLGVVVWGLVVVAGLLAVTQVSGETLLQLTIGLNTVGLVLVLLNGVPAVLGALDRSSGLDERAPIDFEVVPGKDLPDIWYLVPDRFGRTDTLASSYGIDNAAFVAGLRELGFQVFDQAATNYPQSLTSITAALNLDYLEDPPSLSDRTQMELAKFNDHLVGQLLEQAGYEYVHLGNWADFSKSAARADRVLTSHQGSAFATEFVDLTVLPAIEALFSHQPDGTEKGGAYELQRTHTTHQIQTLDMLADENSEQPQFVFSHLILPHEPFIFDADGTRMTEADVQRLGWSEAYGRQLAFTQDWLTSLVERLVAREDPPIIIIQADEGPLPEWFYERGDEPFATLTEEEVRLHNTVLSAVFVPGGSLPLDEAEPVTSINVVRAAISHALGLGLERLEDRSYTFETAWDSPYVEVTNLVFLESGR